MIIPLMAAELFGLRRMGRVMGIVLTADGVAEAVVPMAVATLRDRTGSYGPGFALLVSLAFVGAAAVAFLPTPRGRRVYNDAETVENSAVAHARPSINKRLRETQKKERQAHKAERRSQRAEERKGRPPEATAEDPDLAGIVPGPQPVPWADELTEEEK